MPARPRQWHPPPYAAFSVASSVWRFALSPAISVPARPRRFLPHSAPWVPSSLRKWHLPLSAASSLLARTKESQKENELTSSGCPSYSTTHSSCRKTTDKQIENSSLVEKIRKCKSLGLKVSIFQIVLLSCSYGCQCIKYLHIGL